MIPRTLNAHSLTGILIVTVNQPIRARDSVRLSSYWRDSKPCRILRYFLNFKAQLVLNLCLTEFTQYLQQENHIHKAGNTSVALKNYMCFLEKKTKGKRTKEDGMDSVPLEMFSNVIFKGILPDRISTTLGDFHGKAFPW